jgi:hypothetical protein
MQVTETGDVRQELEIVEVVADQVVVPLSHASLPEESQAMRKTLAEQNHELVQARRDAHMATTKKAISGGIGLVLFTSRSSAFSLLSLLEKWFIRTPGYQYWCRLVTVADTNNG